MAKVLVVDDEPHIVEVVRAYLERDGHEVRTAADGPSALGEVAAWSPEVVILDVMLPGRSGFDVLRDLRAGDRSPGVILVTARDEVADRVAGLELGADDYVTKPFEPRELAARVSAVLRRVASAAPASPGLAADGGATRARTFRDLHIDPAAREVRRAESTISLTRTEFEILDALTEQPGRVWSRPQLGERAFGESFEAYDRTIDSHVKNLRHKLGARPDGGGYLETVRGVGYRAARP
jgi:DNA-binding response OmpR family regulator